MPDGARYMLRRNRLANGAETAVDVVRYRQAGPRSGTSFSGSCGAWATQDQPARASRPIVTALSHDVAS